MQINSLAQTNSLTTVFETPYVRINACGDANGDYYVVVMEDVTYAIIHSSSTFRDACYQYYLPMSLLKNNVKYLVGLAMVGLNTYVYYKIIEIVPLYSCPGPGQSCNLSSCNLATDQNCYTDKALCDQKCNPTQTQGYSCSNCSSPTTCTPNVTPNCYGSQSECNTWCAGGTTGYSCSNCATTTTCTPGVTPNCYSSSQECTTQCPTGTGNYSCIDSCTTPTTCTPGVTSGCYASQTECTNNCASQMCLFGSCYQKNDIYAVAGAVVLFMMMSMMK